MLKLMKMVSCIKLFTCVIKCSLVVIIATTNTRKSVDFLKVLHFFLVGYAILKDFSYLFGAKFTGRKFYRWRHDNWPIGQWVIFHAAPDTAYVNHVFPREFIIWFKSIHAKQVDLETWSLARSLRDPIHWSALRSLLDLTRGWLVASLAKMQSLWKPML